MKNSQKIKIASLFSTAAILGSVAALKLNNNVSEPSVVINTNTPSIESTLENKYQFHYENDTVDLEQSVNSLNIVYDDYFPYASYKVLRFVDIDGYERIAVALSFVDYITDESGKIVDTKYHYFDAFNNNYILTTSDKKDIKEYTSNVISYLIDSGDLLSLRRIVIDKGLDSDYAYSIMKDGIKNYSMTKYQVGMMYVLLVNSSNRPNYESQMILANN